MRSLPKSPSTSAVCRDAANLRDWAVPVDFAQDDNLVTAGEFYEVVVVVPGDDDSMVIHTGAER